MNLDLINKFLDRQLSFADLKNTLSSIEPEMIQFALYINSPVPVHESIDIPAQSFSKFYKIAQKYLEEVQNNCLHADGWVDGEKLSTIGQRPNKSKPLYFLTVENSDTKNIVYVGRTSADTSRFKCGHAAITMLHNPKYNSKKKFVYMCEVIVRIKQEDWIPIEYHHEAQTLLADLEAQLIYQLNPDLNHLDSKVETAQRYTIIHDNKHKINKMDGFFFGPEGRCCITPQ